ncbi:MAG TPA: hypothetical protein VK476_01225, partial [Flavobacterium sp.]|nr:hypothetical protein [Flavobacterium sp.]
EIAINTNPDLTIRIEENRCAKVHLSIDFIDDEVRYPYKLFIFLGGKIYITIAAIVKIPPIKTNMEKKGLSRFKVII